MPGCLGLVDVFKVQHPVKPAFPSLIRRLCGVMSVVSVSLWPVLMAPAQTLELIPLAGSVWRYDDSGTDLGTAWRAASYPAESGWRTGTGMFGVEPTVPYPYPVAVNTPLVLGANRITYYFRTRFTVSSPPASLVVQASANVDDGAVFYLNGQEVGRVRVPDQPVVYTSKAQLAHPEGLAHVWLIPSGALVQGENVLAVEVHQNSSSSSDVLFGLGLTATLAVAPSILNPSEPADRIVPQGQPTTLLVSGTGNPAPAYQWYRNGAPLPGATGSNYAIASFMASDAGQYYAVLSNSAGSATSRVAQVGFLADTNPPAVLYALARADLTQVEIVFSEPPQIDSATDVVNWSLETADGSATLNLVSIFPLTPNAPTNFVCVTETPRLPGVSYVLRTLQDIFDPFGNPLPAGTVVPVAGFTNALIVLASQNWRYEDSGAFPGPSWAGVAFNDTGWSNGLAVMDAYRAFVGQAPPLCRNLLAGTLETVRTCLSLSNSQHTAQLSAAYFRTHFQFTGSVTGSVLQLRLLVDDGAVVYLNGAELLRVGMATGSVAQATLAARTVGNPAWETFLVPRGALVLGDNVLAVEVHQDSLGSPDLTFGLELKGILPSPPPQPRAEAAPRLQAALAGPDLSVVWTPASGRLQAAPGVQGPWEDVAVVESGRHLEFAGASRRFFRVLVP